MGFLNGEPQSIQDSSEITCLSVSIPVTTKFIRTPLQLIISSHILKIVDSYVLINSRAHLSCIDYDFVRKYKLPISKFKVSIYSRNANGSLNQWGGIWYTCTLFSNIKGIAQKIDFYIMSLKDNVILELSWLWSTNTVINWTAQTLSIDESKFLFAFHKFNVKNYNFAYQLPVHPSWHINVDAITNLCLYEYNQWKKELAFINWACEHWTIQWII